MILTEKTFLVLGNGKTGVSIANFFERTGVAYRHIDENAVQLYPPLESKKNQKVLNFEGCYCAVTSPHYTNKWVLYEIERHHIPIISDVELFFRLSKSPILAVTGTNGKSTTVSLLADMLGRRSRTLLLGNIGIPCLDYVEETDPEIPAVVEASSFQLERTELFRPQISAILNITPDHLDFHKTYDNYRNAKFKIFRNQGKTESLVLNADEPLTAPEGPNVVWFSIGKQVDGAYISEGKIMFRGECVAAVSDLALPGRHNLSNALCAVAMAKLSGLSNDLISASLREFGGIEHRIEFVREVGGKRWINDSKATNIASCAVAVSTFTGSASASAAGAGEDRPAKICLIAGGRSVENFDSFVLQIAKKTESVIAFGESAVRIAESCKKFGFPNVRIAESLAAAVELAAASESDLVLFSPACKSFDGYRNFEERGAEFKELVAKL